MATWNYNQIPVRRADWDVFFIASATDGPSGDPCYKTGITANYGNCTGVFNAPVSGTWTIGYKVSSEAGKDFIRANNAKTYTTYIFSASGEVNWTYVTVRMDKGEKLEITYSKSSKDVAGMTGLDKAWITLNFDPDKFPLNSKAYVALTCNGNLSGGGSLMTLKSCANMILRTIGRLSTYGKIKAKSTIRLLARQGTAQAPSGLALSMKIIADQYQPDMILDQYLLIWFNGHPNKCQVALKIDEGAEFQPAFTWQNPGITNPAIIKIDSAEIASDGKNHNITVSVWQSIANRTSARTTISEFARTPAPRPPTQPEWCGATTLRQGTLIRGEWNWIVDRVGDLTKIDWRHTGAVRILAKLPTRSATTGAWSESTITIGYGDYNETSFTVGDIGLFIGLENGDLRDVLFGVASIHGGMFGPVTWANAPVKIREAAVIAPTPVKTPDEKTGTALFYDVNAIREAICRMLAAEHGWIYAADSTVNVPQRDIAYYAIDKALQRIKDATRKGGSITLDDLGRFEARWNAERTIRSVSFVASQGFTDGTKTGYVLTDAQAKAMQP
jgi:nucleoid DNA-binding protein